MTREGRGGERGREQKSRCHVCGASPRQGERLCAECEVMVDERVQDLYFRGGRRF